MNPQDKVYVAGHTGLVGSALVKKLQQLGYVDVVTRTHAELDLSDRDAVLAFFREARPGYVFVAAARAGGIHANQVYAAEFIRENLAIALNVIDAAHQASARKLLFLSSSCVYPKHAPQPMKEEFLLSGPLEPTNEAYAIAKIAGMKLCEAYHKQYGDHFFSVLPTNLYGPNDNFDLETSHVLPALVRKFHEAKVNRSHQVVLWGTGTPRREFMHADDLADACVFLMAHYDGHEPLNIGVGQDITIAELAKLIGRVVGFDGEVAFDSHKPDGTPRKLLDVTRLRGLGWSPAVDLETGVRATYDWYRARMTVTAHSH